MKIPFVAKFKLILFSHNISEVNNDGYVEETQLAKLRQSEKVKNHKKSSERYERHESSFNGREFHTSSLTGFERIPCQILQTRFYKDFSIFNMDGLSRIGKIFLISVKNFELYTPN